MPYRADGDDAAVGTIVGVTTALEELKSRGSALLVVGPVPGSIYAQLSARLLGEGPDRRRLLVDPERSPERRLAPVERWAPEWTRVLRCRVAGRRSAATVDASDTQGGSRHRECGPDADPAAGAGPSPGPGTDPDSGVGADGYGSVAETVDGSIADLGAAVGDTIRWFDDVAAGLDPAELRVGFDCVAPLLSTYPNPVIFRFLHLLSFRIRRVGGMGHVRLSRPLDSRTVRLLAPLFDAIIQLRLDGTDAVHRWHFRDADVVSEWLPVDATV